MAMEKKRRVLYDDDTTLHPWCLLPPYTVYTLAQCITKGHLSILGFIQNAEQECLHESHGTYIRR